jgi:lipopolysaccharide transport system ATP-binding protein
MSRPALYVRNLSKQYDLGVTVSDLWTRQARLVNRLLGRRENGSAGSIWALDDVSFDVAEGDVVGIIGRNGAGKSTLLKILSRITEPTSGTATIYGRVGSLLEVGTGFHPELTGRENVYLNGAVLGMGRPEVRRKFEEIIAFAEVERFIDTPVKRYSSGMYVRLAFAVAAHLEPEILIVDEVLAVGDTAFQRKCLGKMGSVAREGRTVLFVSHNMGAISELCTRAILLSSGAKTADGDVGRVLEEYSKGHAQNADAGAIVKLANDPELPCSIIEVSIATGSGVADRFDLDDEVVLSVKYEVTRTVGDLLLNVTLARNLVDILTTFDTDGDIEIAPKLPGVYVARHRIPPGFLKGGMYTVSVGSGTPTTCLQVFDNVLRFEIEELTRNTLLRGYRRDRPGHVISPGRWETERLS